MKRPYLLALLLAGSLLTMATECRKEYPPQIPVYEFTEKLNLTPYKKIYAVGDTIWVQFQAADKKLFDRQSNSLISMDTTFLQIKVYMQRWFPLDHPNELYDSVITANTPGMTYTAVKDTPGFNALQFLTVCNEHSYFFQIGFIPQLTGIYSINPYGILLNCPDKIYFPYSTFRFTFDLTDCNKDIWLSIPNIKKAVT